MADRRIEAGVVRSVEYTRRRIRVRPLPNQAGNLDLAGWVWVVFDRPGPEQPRELRCKLEEVRMDADDRLMTFTPGVTRDSVALMKGATILVEAREETVEYGLADIIGLDVVDVKGTLLGVVAEVYPSIAGGAFDVQRNDGSRFVLPAIEQVIESIDLEGRVVVVTDDIRPYIVEDED